jgi:integrase
VFAHPETAARLRVDRYAVLLRKALEEAGISDGERIRPFHDARHCALTHLALAPEASEFDADGGRRTPLVLHHEAVPAPRRARLP